MRVVLSEGSVPPKQGVPLSPELPKVQDDLYGSPYQKDVLQKRLHFSGSPPQSRASLQLPPPPELPTALPPPPPELPTALPPPPQLPTALPPPPQLPTTQKSPTPQLSTPLQSLAPPQLTTSP